MNAVAPYSPLRLSRVATLVEASLLSESLTDFAKASWHILEPSTELKWGWVLDAICDHLAAVSRGEIKRLLMNVPPGCMKSLLTGVVWPAWEWTQPALQANRFIGTSHKVDLALRDSVKCRRLIQSDWYQARWPLKLLGDQNAKSKFENEYTGFREAASFTGMTGSRGDRITVDDPLSVDGGNSEADLLSVETTFRESLPTRVNNDDSAIVVIMQRLHERDPSGIILAEGLGYTHLMLPMRFEPERRCVTSIGFRDPRKVDGELLFPERFPEAQVAELEKTLGEYATAGQLQQSPTPRGGGMFKTVHLQSWPHGRVTPVFDYIILSYDTAFTEKTANDPTACTVWGTFAIGKKRAVLLLEAWDDHMNYATLRRRLIKEWKEVYGADDTDAMRPGRRADECLLENKGSGISLLQELRAANVPAMKYNPGDADKYGRAQQIMPVYESDCIYVPMSEEDPTKFAPWAQPFVSQLGKFGPGVSAHDDYVDTFTQAVIRLRDLGKLDTEVAEDDEPPEKPYGGAKGNPYSS